MEATALSQVRNALYNHSHLLERHICNYTSLYGHFKLRLLPDAAHVSTNERLLLIPDPGLVALYANYGRYLLISCSRPGHKALPATLQGLWNLSFQPAWGSKYTININTQMKYWPANIRNLEECEDPLLINLSGWPIEEKRLSKSYIGTRARHLIVIRISRLTQTLRIGRWRVPVSFQIHMFLDNPPD